MAAVSWLNYAYLARFSKPRSARQLYRLVKRNRVCRIVEVGVGSVERAASLIRVAQRYGGQEKVSYTGIDWFDARPADLPQLTLKETHCRLQATGAQVRLVPGEPARSIAATANAHQHTGLLLIAAFVYDSSLTPAWFYVPRMLDPDSIVLRELRDSAGQSVFETLPAVRIAKMAAQSTARRVA